MTFLYCYGIIGVVYKIDRGVVYKIDMDCLQNRQGVVYKIDRGCLQNRHPTPYYIYRVYYRVYNRGKKAEWFPSDLFSRSAGGVENLLKAFTIYSYFHERRI